MACTATSLMSSEDAMHQSASTAVRSRSQPRNRRRHSSFRQLRRRVSADLNAEAVYIKIDMFLSELENRLDRLHAYGTLTVDSGIQRAYTTLETVSAACTTAPGDLVDAGRKQAKVVVDILEARYNGVLATKETLEGKAYASLRLMEGFLADLETRAHAVRDAGFSGVIHEGRQRAESSLKSARVAVDEGWERAWQAKQSLKVSIEHAVQRAREHGLLRYEDLPVPWRGNPHIIRGYRFSESTWDCVQSAFQLSNETVNIWSHALGLVFVLSLAFYFYPMSGNWILSSKRDIFFAALFFFAACKCLVCSVMWHTMNSISNQTVMERFACVDYTGISLLIAATIMTVEYTAFYCEPVSQWSYLILTGVLGVGGVIIPWHPFFNRADMVPVRVAFYIALGATGFLPMIHLSFTRSVAWAVHFYAPIANSIIVYLVGAAIYANKIPEKFFPGGFDYIGCSHNIWHVAVLVGIVFHYSAMYDMYSIAFNRAKHECVSY